MLPEYSVYCSKLAHVLEIAWPPNSPSSSVVSCSHPPPLFTHTCAYTPTRRRKADLCQVSYFELITLKKCWLQAKDRSKRGTINSSRMGPNQKHSFLWVSFSFSGSKIECRSNKLYAVVAHRCANVSLPLLRTCITF